MHGSVRAWFLPSPLKPDEITDRDVLEVGALDVNGSIRPLVEVLRPRSYLAVDVVEGPGVDKVVDAEHLIDSFGYSSFDTVICCETMEHVDDWRSVLGNMAAVLRPGGVLVVTTRSAGFGYHHPPDRWRYSLDGLRAAVEALGFEVRTIAEDPEWPGVFVKARKPASGVANIWSAAAFRGLLSRVEGITPMRQPIKLLMLPAGVDGCGYYRMWQPAKAMQVAGMAEVMIPPPYQQGFLPNLEVAESFEVIAMQRPCTRAVADAWDWWKAKAPHVKLVAEFDDNVLHADTSLHNWVNDELKETTRRCLRLADMVTVSTPRLAEVFRPETDAPVVVIPNRIHRDLLDLGDALRESRNADRVTLGFAGGQTHFRDLMLPAVHGALNWVLDEHPDLDLHFVGYDDPASAFRDRGRFTGWEHDVWNYYRAIDFDIGVIPLRSSPFNDTRSPIKALEYAALGIPIVASNVPAYAGYVRHAVDGFLVDNDQPDLWRQALETLIARPELRAKMGADARATAARWTIQEHWTDWWDAYEGVLGRL